MGKRKQIWLTLTPKQRDMVDRAVALAGWDSRTEFMRELVIAHSRRVLLDYGEVPPDHSAESEEALSD